MENEKRMAGEYEIIHAVQIGDREIMVGENSADTNGQKYMTAFCESNELFARYDEVLVSDDYPEIMKYFGERIAQQAEKTRAELFTPKFQGIDVSPITAEACTPITGKDDSERQDHCDQAGDSASGIPQSDQSGQALHRRVRREPQQPGFGVLLQGCVFR